MNLRPFTLAAVVPSLLLASCGKDGGSEPEAEASGEKRSIFRPEFQVEPIESLEPQGSLQTLVQFPEGAELTEEARAELATILASPQVQQGGPIILRGHSDSGGSDEGNMRASRARAEAVRDWLVDSGVDEARISMIAFGEQNPVAPNARPDGSPDPVGRAANRRVEIEVRSENAEPEEETPTLAETLAGSVEEESGESAESPE